MSYAHFQAANNNNYYYRSLDVGVVMTNLIEFRMFIFVNIKSSKYNTSVG